MTLALSTALGSGDFTASRQRECSSVGWRTEADVPIAVDVWVHRRDAMEDDLPHRTCRGKAGLI